MSHFVPDYKTLEFSGKQSENLLIIPVINEGERLLNQLKRIQKADISIDILVADGGSTDESIANHERLRGLGVRTALVKTGPGRLSAQLLTAFDYALENEYRNIITMDGNGKDDPACIERFIQKLNEGYDFIQGSRFLPGGIAENTPLKRMLAIKLIHAPITSLAAGRRYTDTTNGFRGFSNSALRSEKLNIFRNVFSTYELLAYLPIRIARVGMKVTEIPVARRYPNIGPIPTKIKGTFGELELLAILLRAALGFYNPEKR